MPENRLVNEKSPYLLQYAHSLVYWYPWGTEAFETARQQGKPIFLSIGCLMSQACRVMARESFDHPVIAQRLNDVFVCIKVDQEERPDIGDLYMEFAQALMASAVGWPLHLILTPELKPFYAITYLPPGPHQGMMGLDELIHHIEHLWLSEDRELLVDQAEHLVAFFGKSMIICGSELPTEQLMNEAINTLFEEVDPVYGGLQGSSKFPVGYQLLFFLNYSKSHQDARALFFVEKTLDAMSSGGIYDHVGAGFFRDSIDEKWFAPRFTKTLYDNALLASAYLNAWKFTKKERFKTICYGILEYILRDMRHPEGGFYSMEDDEVDGIKGSFYLWPKKEINKSLPSDQVDLFCKYFDVTDEGNFNGTNILYPTLPLEEFCKEHRLNPVQLEEMFKDSLALLLKKRGKRKRPFKDDKVLVSWNGLVIEALVQAGIAFNNLAYVQAGEEGVMFIRSTLWKKGKLFRRFREGNADCEGLLDDYVFLIRALITLYEAGRGKEFLEWALEMTDYLEREYKADEGAFYLTRPNELIPMRRCVLEDNRQPSGNAIHAENLFRLYQITHQREFKIQGEDILKASKSLIETYPQGYFYHLIAAQRYLDERAITLIIALNGDRDYEEEIKGLVFGHFNPHISIVWKSRSEDYPLIKGKTTLYPCKEGKCLPPITEWNQMQDFIQQY